MEERVMQFRVGVLVAATVIIGLILIVLFGEMPRAFGGRKTVYIRFDSAPGVTINTPVRKSGILVGRVTDVRLDQGGVLITARLDANRNVQKNETCQISSASFLGDSMLEFVPGGVPGESTEPLEDGAYLEGVVSKNVLDLAGDFMAVVTDSVVDLKEALVTVQRAGDEVGKVAENMNTLVVNNQTQFNRIMGKTEQAVGQFDTAMTNVNQIVSDEELILKLKEVLDQVPQLLTDAGELITGLGRVADEAEQNLLYLQGLTKPLGDQGEQLVTSMQQSLDRLDGVLLELHTFSKSINEGRGSLGRFVNDPELYQRLNNAAANVEELTYRLQPVVENTRVISDKLARNPGRILRGAFGRQQSGLK